MRSKGEQGMRLLVLFIGLAVLVSGVGSIVTVGVGGSHVTDQLERTFTAASTQQITVRSSNGRITYEPWDGDDIRIEATTRVSALTSGWAERLGSGVNVEFAHNGGQVRAEVQRRGGWFLFGNVGVHFLVRVPHDWSGEVALTSSNGAITARDLVGDATLRTSNGAIVVEGHTGALEVRTSNGRIDMTGSDGTVQVQTSNGAIRITDATLSGTGRVRTSNGSVTFEARLVEGAAYDVTTSNGPVTIVLTEPDVALDMKTSNGGIHLQTEVSVSRVDRKHVSGRIGTGASALNVRTSNGSISLGAKPWGEPVGPRR